MNYRDLIAWQRAVDLAELVYHLVKRLPPAERFDLASQMRRSARSVAANIAEGYGRGRIGDYRRHLSFANGSLLELETDLELIRRVKLLEETDIQRCTQLAQETGRILAGLRNKLRQTAKLGQKGPDA